MHTRGRRAHGSPPPFLQHENCGEGEGVMNPIGSLAVAGDAPTAIPVVFALIVLLIICAIVSAIRKLIGK
jgi:hypothetical protein